MLDPMLHFVIPPVHPRGSIAWSSCGGRGGLVAKSPGQTPIGEAGADQGPQTGSWRGLVCRSNAGRTTRGGGHCASAPGICRDDACAAPLSARWHVGTLAAWPHRRRFPLSMEYLLMLKRRDMEGEGGAGG